METTAIHIIIVHFNNPGDTFECVQHLFAQHYSRWKVFIVDNGSRESELLELKDRLQTFTSITELERGVFNVSKPEQWKKLTVIRSAENLGYGGAVNLVLKQMMETDVHCLLLNPDVLLASNALHELMHCVSNAPNCIHGCKVMEADRDQVKYFGGFSIHHLTGTIRFIRKYENIDDLDSISGGCLFAHIAIFRETGIFPEDYFLYWEDADWCRQAQKKGIQLRVCTSAHAFDKGSTTIGSGYLAEYYYTLNALKYVQKGSSVYPIFILFFNGLRALKRLIQFRFSNFRAILTASYHYVISREAIRPQSAGQGE